MATLWDAICKERGLDTHLNFKLVVSKLEEKLKDPNFNPFDINRAYDPNREGLHSFDLLRCLWPSSYRLLG
jgi:hypothetical protein